MSDLYLHRTLKWDGQPVSEQEALAKGPLLVVLAEPGAGKSELLREFGRQIGVVPIRASRFRHQSILNRDSPLIIDALDEAAKIDQTAVDLIVVKAQESSNGRVVFASRSSEWQEARTRFIHECFGIEPVIIRIQPLSEEEQRALLQDYCPGESFDVFAGAASQFQLTPLLGNPQFLKLLADAFIQAGRRFTSKSQIFDDAVHKLAIEAGDAVLQPNRPTTATVIERASAVMSTLLLAGAAGVTTREVIADRDYPFLGVIFEGQINPAETGLDTKLFLPALEVDRHEPVHRMVAEYCSAKHLLSRVADTSRPLSLKRILSVVAPNGVVRDELRGLLGWMASHGPERVQNAAIGLDAYAVIANGDPSRLTSQSKRYLLKRLEEIASTNPGFRRSDNWRSFSVGGFFTQDIADSISALLRSPSVPSQLLDLLLELISNSNAPQSMAESIRAILLNSGAERHTRTRAETALRSILGSPQTCDIVSLLEERSPTSLMIATQMVMEVGPENFDDTLIENLLRAHANFLSAPRRLRNDSRHMSSFHLGELVKRLSSNAAAQHLDTLTEGLSCTCNRERFECACRSGVSSVAGRLLDRYFEDAVGPYDPNRIWQWLRALWFQHPADPEKNAAVRVLSRDQCLRHQLHRRVFEGVSEHDQGWEIFWQMGSHSHSGLRFQEMDTRLMADYAFETANPGLWSLFLSAPSNHPDRKGPDAFRRHLREQASMHPEFQRTWYSAQRHYRKGRRERFERWERRNRKILKSQQEEAARQKAQFEIDRPQIENGSDWDWVRLLAHYYLHDRPGLDAYTSDIPFVETALLNCLPEIKKRVPSVKLMSTGRNWTASSPAVASCYIKFRNERDLGLIDRDILIFVFFEASQANWMPEEEYKAFRNDLRHILFKDAENVEKLLRNYIEPGMLRPREAHTSVWWLANEEAFASARAKLSMEWLWAFPNMPISARNDLFDIAASTCDRSSLLSLIRQSVKDKSAAPATETEEEQKSREEDLEFWRIREFIFGDNELHAWDDMGSDPNLVLALSHILGRFGSRRKGWPALGADKIFRLLDAFIDSWPPVPLPSSFATGDPPGEQAYRFLSDIVWEIDSDAPARSLPVLDRMLLDNRFTIYSEALLTMRAEATKKLALANFNAPLPQDIATLLNRKGIASVEDLRSFVVEELEWLQASLRTAETDRLDPFYNGADHVDENIARNRVVDSLKDRMHALNMPVAVEHHMSDQNRCDFTVSAMVAGQRRLLVVEAKGQWHPELYTAAERQLSDRYASHQDAELQGIYLVFWYGPKTKVAGRVQHDIATAGALQTEIAKRMPPALRGLIDVVVLDLSRPKRAPKRPPKS